MTEAPCENVVCEQCYLKSQFCLNCFDPEIEDRSISSNFKSSNKNNLSKFAIQTSHDSDSEVVVMKSTTLETPRKRIVCANGECNSKLRGVKI